MNTCHSVPNKADKLASSPFCFDSHSSRTKSPASYLLVRPTIQYCKAGIRISRTYRSCEQPMVVSSWRVRRLCWEPPTSSACRPRRWIPCFVGYVYGVRLMVQMLRLFESGGGWGGFYGPHRGLSFNWAARGANRATSFFVLEGTLRYGKYTPPCGPIGPGVSQSKTTETQTRNPESLLTQKIATA